MAKIEIVLTNGLRIVADADDWVAAIIVSLPPEQQQRVLQVVREHRPAPANGHVISVPGIVSGEGFGRLGG